MKEPRYKLTDTETGKNIMVSTDELQAIYWLAEKEVARKRKRATKASAAEYNDDQV